MIFELKKNWLIYDWFSEAGISKKFTYGDCLIKGNNICCEAFVLAFKPLNLQKKGSELLWKKLCVKGDSKKRQFSSFLKTYWNSLTIAYLYLILIKNGVFFVIDTTDHQNFLFGLFVGLVLSPFNHLQMITKLAVFWVTLT